MADLAYPTALMSPPGAIEGRAPQRYTGLQGMLPPSLISQDLRHVRSTAGIITDQVVLKVNASAEVPFVNGRVWLLRLADGYKAWEGWSNATGHYTATGLEVGVKYVAICIDPYNNHKTTGAGPVTAT